METTEPRQASNEPAAARKWIRAPHIFYGGDHGRLAVDIVVIYVSNPIDSLDLSVFQYGQISSPLEAAQPSTPERDHPTRSQEKELSIVAESEVNQHADPAEEDATSQLGDEGQSKAKGERNNGDGEDQVGSNVLSDDTQLTWTRISRKHSDKEGQRMAEEERQDNDGEEQAASNVLPGDTKPTWTRMSLKYLDIETLNYFKVDWELDPEDSGYALIKRWVPEHEQDMLWMHTRNLRRERELKSKKGDEFKLYERPTYTRMSLRHLDVETLDYYKIDFEYDQEPGYVLIKRWVPEWEQDLIWEHTRKLRLSRESQGDEALSCNWVVDKKMIRKSLPAARVICFGIDLAAHTETSIDFDAAGSELRQELQELRREFQSRKLVLVGHGYGNVLISKLLGASLGVNSLLESTAAISFFGAPWTSTQSLVSYTVAELKVSRLSKLFIGSSPNPPITFQVQQMLRGLITSETRLSVILDNGATSSMEDTSATDHKGTAQALFDSLELLMNRNAEIADVAKFQGAQDGEFRQLIQHLSVSIEAFQLLSAAKTDDRAVITELMNKSADLTRVNKKGQTALHIAAENGSRKVFDLLLATRSFNLQSRDRQGNTVLHAAVKRGGASCRDFVKQLLAAGARPDLKNNIGHVPAQLLPLPSIGAEGVLELLESPQRVIGPMLTLLEPTVRSDGQRQACQMVEMSVRELYAAHDMYPDSHIRLYPTVDKFVYGTDAPDKLFPAPAVQPMCQWYHLPMNNMSWVVDLFVKLDLQVWPWPQGYRDYETPHSRSVYAQITKLKPLGHISEENPTVWGIMMPYISYEDSAVQKEVADLMKGRDIRDIDATREDVIRRIYKSEDSKLSGLIPEEDLSDGDLSDLRDTPVLRSEVKETISQYLNAEGPAGRFPLHPRRTLDQSYYYMLSDTSYRDRTQVVSRWIRKLNESRPRKQRNHNILMVDQMWLWFVRWPDSRHTVITCFPNRDSTASKLDDLVLSDGYRDPMHHTYDLVSQILAECCKTLKLGQDDDSTKFIEMFEGTIGDVEERNTRLFGEFQFLSSYLSNIGQSDRDRQYRKLRATLLKHLDIQKEVKLLTEVKDILDEIKMIEAVLTDQKNILCSDYVPQLHRETTHNTGRPSSYFSTALDLVSRALDNFGNMKARTETVEKQIERLLDLKQKQANAWEAQITRDGAEETARQGSTLLVFTVVTIIFLPLSFMASFFALTVDQFPKDDSGDTSWPLKEVSGLLFGISLAVSIPFIFSALYVETLKDSWSAVWYGWVKRDSTYNANYDAEIQKRLVDGFDGHGDGEVDDIAYYSSQKLGPKAL